MSISASLNGAQGSGGSATSGQAVADSWSNSVSDSWSRTYGSEATAKSYEEAIRATQRQQEMFDQTKAYNSMEAYAQRAFNEMMGNTIYTRSVKNMIEAGINPILAANMGLSGASVQSGAAASLSTPSAFMGQTFADQASASHSESHSRSHSESSNEGSGWQNSESGLATGLAQLGKYFAEGLSAVNSGVTLNLALDGMQKTAEVISEAGGKNDKNKDGKVTTNEINKKEKGQSVGNWLINQLDPRNSPLFTTLYNQSHGKIKEVPYKY